MPARQGVPIYQSLCRSPSNNNLVCNSAKEYIICRRSYRYDTLYNIAVPRSSLNPPPYRNDIHRIWHRVLLADRLNSWPLDLRSVRARVRKSLFWKTISTVHFVPVHPVPWRTVRIVRLRPSRDRRHCPRTRLYRIERCIEKSRIGLLARSYPIIDYTIL